MQCAGRWRRKAPLPSRPLSALTAGRLVSGSFSLASRPATTLSSRSTSSAMLARAVRYSMHNCCYKCRSMLSRLRRKGALVALRAQPAQQRLFVLHWGGSRLSIACSIASIYYLVCRRAAGMSAARAAATLAVQPVCGAPALSKCSAVARSAIAPLQRLPSRPATAKPSHRQRCRPAASFAGGMLSGLARALGGQVHAAGSLALVCEMFECTGSVPPPRALAGLLVCSKGGTTASPTL